MNRLELLIISVLGVMIAGLFNPLSLNAQAPQSIAYQAIVRDADGIILTNQMVTLQMKFHQGSSSGPVVYCEVHHDTTNTVGLVNLAIGIGTVISGSFQDIDWATGQYYMEVELDPVGGTAYVPLGTTQLVSVPYALYSDNTARIQDNPVSPAAPDLDEVLQWNGSQWTPATISGGGGSGWLLTGNASTDPAVNFVGTTDNQPLKFRVNNSPAGEINQITNNTFLGLQSGGNSTGTNNTAMGREALWSNTGGFANTAIGSQALYSNMTGYYNTANGYAALWNNSEGAFNAAFGAQALYANTTGIQNTASGFTALHSNETGNNNTAHGAGALYSNTTGNNNTANGSFALTSNISGSYNTAQGDGALYSNTTGSTNTANGFQALFSNTSGDGNTASGVAALFSNTTGFNNTASGSAALHSNTSGDDNTGSGFMALYSNTTGTSNTAYGYSALLSNKANNRSTAIGYMAMYYANNTENGQNTYNTALGSEALKGSSIPGENTGTFNTAVGDQALYNNKSGFRNTVSGSLALYSNTTGSGNTADGFSALYSNIAGWSNTANGWQALWSNSNGSENTAIGSHALFSNTGDHNTALGCQAGYNNSSGSDNVFIGFRAGQYETGSNKFYLANSSINPPLIYGDFSTGNIGLGTITPHSSAKLEVSSINQGFLPPRLTASQRTAIASPALGLLVFQTDAASGYYYYTGANWVRLEGSGPGSNSSSICIDYDGNAYPTITIGTQVWMAENLRVAHYSNGDPIPNVTDYSEWAALTTGAYCRYSNAFVACARYGNLYNWYAVDDARGLCPVGWHEPTDAEWTSFTNYLGGEDVAGGKMKSVSALWEDPNLGATNNSGFSGLPGGVRSDDGNFYYLLTYGYFWTSSQDDPASAWSRDLRFNGEYVNRYNHYKKGGFSVRCLKDFP